MDFDESFFDLTDDDEEQTEPDPTPTWRATIRRDKLMLTAWAPWLITGGPLGTLLPARARSGVTIADLTVHGADEDEVSARFLVRAKSAEAADELLIDWAGKVGYRRVWLPDRLVEIERDPEAIDSASVRCDVCHAKWSDATPEFWLLVHDAKAFPKWCPVCGCELPQWTTRPTDNPRLHNIGEGERWTSSGSRRRTRHSNT